ncbi:unnamed protein product [Cyprideis torosa]|uniref:Uncharacterized protein n=1 Tax=Cyprideis torosa TaxID=163714 RepID=A0A7R8W5U9_9CRUS|nr:unnamed protein product [Cyprideis torosa]CAG0880242.1 unnamed protein product [Cyprideis torosa]
MLANPAPNFCAVSEDRNVTRRAESSPTWGDRDGSKNLHGSIETLLSFLAGNVNVLSLPAFRVLCGGFSSGHPLMDLSLGAVTTMVWPVVLPFLFFFPAYCSSLGTLLGGEEHQCEPISIDLCQGLGYNETLMPNLVGDHKQQDAFFNIQSFTPLIQIGCSSQIRLFLCAAYVPMCSPHVPNPIGPCRSMCESVRDRCSYVMDRFGIPWPLNLNCSKFPAENNHITMCMEGPGEREDPPSYQTSIVPGRMSPRPSDPYRPPPPSVMVDPEASLPPVKTEDVSSSSPPSPHATTSHCAETPLTSAPPCSGYLQGKGATAFLYVCRSQRCAQLCHEEGLFTRENQRFAEICMGIWAGLCLLSTVFTILTFLLDAANFQYPERPVALLSLCYALMAIAVVVRLVAGRDVIACQSFAKESILVLEGLGNAGCAIIFLLLYYFGLAASLWWFVLCLCLLLTKGLKWRSVDVAQKGAIFHVIAWCIPGVLTLVVLILRKVEADDLTGLCHVGSQSPESLFQFTIMPHLIVLVTGVLCLLLTVWLSWRRHRQHRRNSNMSAPTYPKSQKELDERAVLFRHRRNSNMSAPTYPKSQKELDERAVLFRVGVLAGACAVPLGCLIGTYFYEYRNRESWLAGDSLPNMDVFQTKIFMTFVIGITSGFWMWSTTKTLRAWKRGRICCEGKHFKFYKKKKRDRRHIKFESVTNLAKVFHVQWYDFHCRTCWRGHHKETLFPSYIRQPASLPSSQPLMVHTQPPQGHEAALLTGSHRSTGPFPTPLSNPPCHSSSNFYHQIPSFSVTPAPSRSTQSGGGASYLREHPSREMIL